MALGGAELLILFILFILFMGGIAARDGVPASSVVNGLLNDYINKHRYWPPTQ